MFKLKSTIKKYLLNISPRLYKKFIYKNINAISWNKYFKKKFDPELLLLHTLLVKKNNVFVDIGCNKGDYLYVASKIIPENNCYAFEPNPILANRLKKLFPFAHIVEKAVTNVEGISKFKIPIINGNKDNTLGSLNIIKKEINEKSKEEIIVNTTTFDKWVESTKLNTLSLIKVDIEGSELNFFEGALNSIKTFKPTIILETELRHHNGLLLNDLLLPYKGLGYSIGYFSFKQRSFIEFDFESTEMIQNIKDWGTRYYINNFILIYGKKSFIDFLKIVNNDIHKNCN